MKRIILFLSVLGFGALLVTRYPVQFDICAELDYYCMIYSDRIENILYFIPFVLFFSILTYFTRESVFTAWWRFARVSIPVILIISTIIGMQLHHNSYGLFNMDNLFDIPALLLMYGIFILGSLIQIWRGYKRV